VWGLKSLISGPFGNEEFGDTMRRIDKFLSFLYASPERREKQEVRQRIKKQGSVFLTAFQGIQKAGRLTQAATTTSPSLSSASVAPSPIDDAEPISFFMLGQSLDLGDDNYQGYFAETDLKGNYYECKRLWSTDLAEKWSRVPHPPTKQHQTLLRACNFKSVMVEAVRRTTFCYYYFVNRTLSCMIRDRD
jgi:hypothetical protein